MGVKLPSGFTYTSVFLTVLLSILLSAGAMAQVALTDANLFQISFSLNESITDDGRAVLSRSDLAGPDTGFSYIDASDRTSLSDLPSRFYLNQQNGRVAVSGLPPAEMPDNENVFAYLSVINETGNDLSGLSTAFDFLVHPGEGVASSITLEVRTGQRPWQVVPGSRVQLSDMGNFDSNDWQSFSVQASIENMYSRPGDRIEFRWVLDSAINKPLPLAIQSIELSADKAEPVEMEKGSLIITEIFAGSTGSASEYVELYNPTGSPVPLAGLTVRSGERSVVVQHDVEVLPYSYFVLAESGFASVVESNPGYVYYGRILRSASGFVELRQGNTEAARAAYDISDSRTSIELDRTINGYDGYSSLQNFISSTSDFGNGFRGSPGTRGNSLRHFTTSVAGGETPQLLTVPGLLPASLNRSLTGEIEISNMDGEPVNPGDVEPGEPYLFRSDASATMQIFAEETASSVRSEQPGRISAGNGSFSYLSLPATSGIRLSGLLNEFNQPIVPAAQVWNEETGRFEVILSDAAVLNSWKPLIVNGDIPRPQQAVRESEYRLEAERLITFTVFEEQGGNREVLLDQGYLTFMPDYWTSTGRRYDLPKLMPLPAADRPDIDREISLFYIRNGESNQPVNSFTHLPFEPMNDVRVTADLLSTRNSLQAVLNWSLTDDIPEEWEITLEDQLTGQRINMREQSSYRFRHSSGDPLEIEAGTGDGESPVRLIDTGSPSEDRFTILISPYDSPLGLQEDTEQPGSVELRQNYPNPFNPATNIVYFLPENRQVRIGVYNVVGQQVATLVDEVMSAGEHTATWNASDMPSGIYIVQLESGNNLFTRKITLIK
jgi:hypothetical protein